MIWLHDCGRRLSSDARSRRCSSLFARRPCRPDLRSRGASFRRVRPSSVFCEAVQSPSSTRPANLPIALGSAVIREPVWRSLANLSFAQLAHDAQTELVDAVVE